MDTNAQITIALSVIFSVLLCVICFIVLYYMRKYSRRTFTLADPSNSNHSANSRRRGSVHEAIEMERMGTYKLRDEYYGESDLQTQATFLIPYGLTLLKSCKLLSHRLMSAAIDVTSHNGERFVLGSLDEILAAAKTVSPRVDKLSDAMHPPFNDSQFLLASSELVSSIQYLIAVFSKNCDTSRLHWLEGMASQVMLDFKMLCYNVEKYRQVVAEIEAECDHV